MHLVFKNAIGAYLDHKEVNIQNLQLCACKKKQYQQQFQYARDNRQWVRGHKKQIPSGYYHCEVKL